MRSFDEVILLLRVLCQRKNVIMFQYKKNLIILIIYSNLSEQ